MEKHRQTSTDEDTLETTCMNMYLHPLKYEENGKVKERKKKVRQKRKKMKNKNREKTRIIKAGLFIHSNDTAQTRKMY